MRPPEPGRIAMVSVHSSPIGPLGSRDTGGMSVYIRALARELGRRGHRVDVFTRAALPSLAGRMISLGPNVRLIHLAAGAAGLPKEALLPHLDPFFDALEAFRRRQGVAYDLIHSHYWLSGLVGLRAQAAWGAPHVVTFHTLGTAKPRRRAGSRALAERIVGERTVAQGCDRIVVTSMRERANLLRFCPGSGSKTAVVPCGVDLELFRPIDRRRARREIGVDPEASLVLYVGRFAPEKGLARLLRAIALLDRRPAPQLLIAGGELSEESEREPIVGLARRLGIADRVRLEGRVAQPRLPLYYSAADVLAVPSAYESFGMAALEALACGAPVAATRVGAMAELSGEGLHVRLARSQSAAAFAAAMAELLAERPAASALFAPAAVERYAWPRVADALLTVYGGAMKPGRPAPLSAALRMGG